MLEKTPTKLLIKRSREQSAMSDETLFADNTFAELYSWDGGSRGGSLHPIARVMKYGPNGAAHYGPTTPPEMPQRLLLAKKVRDSFEPSSVRRKVLDMVYREDAPWEIIKGRLNCSVPHAKGLLKQCQVVLVQVYRMEGRRIHVD